MFGRKEKSGSSGTPAFKSFKSPGMKKPGASNAKSPQQNAIDGFKRAAGMGKGKR